MSFSFNILTIETIDFSLSININAGGILETLLFKAFFILSAPSIISAHEKRYKYFDIRAKLFIVLPESIVKIQGKIFVRMADLAIFNTMKKHSKV